MKDAMDTEPLDPTLAAELAALADGSLPAERAAALERRVERSPELTRALAAQRAARGAIQAVVPEPAPARLHEAIAAMVAEAEPPRRRARRWRPTLGWSLPAAVLAAGIVAVVVVSSGSSQPTVADAAEVALRPASAPAPSARPGAEQLSASVDGVAYPDWYASSGWRAVGARSDVRHDRRIRTVVYVNQRGQRIGYAIVAGDALSVDGGRTVVQNGVRMRLLETDGATVVTWRRSGHTCVLAARGVAPGVLLRLASWSGS